MRYLKRTFVNHLSRHLNIILGQFLESDPRSQSLQISHICNKLQMHLVDARIVLLSLCIFSISLKTWSIDDCCSIIFDFSDGRIIWTSFSFKRIFFLASIVVSVFTISFGPFLLKVHRKQLRIICSLLSSFFSELVYIYIYTSLFENLVFVII